MTLHEFLSVVQSFVDAAQKLAPCRFGKLRVVHHLLCFAQRERVHVPDLSRELDSFGLPLENFPVDLAEDDLLRFVGRVDERFTLGAWRGVAVGQSGREIGHNGRSRRDGTAAGASVSAIQVASETTAEPSGFGQRQWSPVGGATKFISNRRSLIGWQAWPPTRADFGRAGLGWSN